ncbi:MAG: DNA-binding transcriptional ArsR family regulator [Haloarculaceae archaeon]|jgi:DNA-binding transcriptional ArsR family regulator
MKDIIEQLQEDIEASTAFSFATSEGLSRTGVQTDPDNDAHPAHDSLSPPYTTTPLTDESVSTLKDWLDDDYLQSIHNEDVIAQLDEILLLLIMLREGACGKELTQDLRRLFGADLSPGTVYPHLNDLADDGILDMIELKKRKIYTTSDVRDTLDMIEPTVNRQVIFSLVLKALLIDIKGRREQPKRGVTHER